MLETYGDFDYPGAGPIERDKLDTVIATVQQRLDLLTVLRVRYAAKVEVAGERWKCACFLPSTVEGFDGTCAQQDARDKGGGAEPVNLYASDGDTTRIWRCFSCGRRGDVIDLIEAADGLTRATTQMVGLSAIRCAAKLAGVAYLLDDRPSDERDDPSDLVSSTAPRTVVKLPPPTVDFTRARAINGIAAKHWRSALALGPGHVARRELKRRGVTPEQTQRFALGFAADQWRALTEALPKAAIDEACVLGLLGRTKQGQLYDRNRNRIMFPYVEPNRDGRKQAVVGFAGRTMSEDPQTPKWFNSRNVEGVYVKSGALLGLLQAKQRMREQDTTRVTVGEGGWEVLAFDRFAAPCVGLVAAPMSEDHVHVLATVLGATRITLAGDGDEAGRRGVFEGIVSALRYGYRVHEIDVIDPPDGIDPGKMGETAAGLDELKRVWGQPQSLESFVEARQAVAKGAQKRALVAVLPFDLAQHFADRWGVPFERQRDALVFDEELSAAANFAAALDQDPALAQHFDGEQVRDVFEDEPLVRRQIRTLVFGESTTLADLPAPLRVAWLSCCADSYETQLEAHDDSDKFTFTPEGGHSSFVAWFGHGEALQKLVKKTRRKLAALQT